MKPDDELSARIADCNKNAPEIQVYVTRFSSAWWTGMELTGDLFGDVSQLPKRAESIPHQSLANRNASRREEG